MLRLLNIWFVVFCMAGVAQNYNPVTEISFPNQIAINTSFDISLITDNSLVDADKLNLYVISRSGIEINSAVVKTADLSFNNIFTASALPGTADKVYLVEINLDRDSIKLQSFLQVILNINPFTNNLIAVNFYGEFIKNESVVAKIGNINQANGNNSKRLKAEIKTYKPGRITRNAARLDKNSNFSIDLGSITGRKLWIGFWSKHSGDNIEIIQISSSMNNVIASFGINQFQRIYLLNEQKDLVNQSAPFFSKKSWSHIGIELDSPGRSLTFYKDGAPVGVITLSGSDQITDLKITFGGVLTSPLEIEQLRILNPKDEIAAIIDDSKYISHSSSSATAILQINFDSMNELLNAAASNIIKYSGIKLVNSDAPVFSRTPNLNVKVLSAYNYLEWNIPDTKNSSHFIVEKSLSGSEFFEIGNISVISESAKLLNYLDASNTSDEIVYYRVKQVNKDGSSVYSSQIKVGMGNFEQFKVNQNYPNPFNPVTSIEFDLFEDTEIEVVIYNLEGQELAVLQKGFLTKGVHKFEFDASNLPSGVYLYKVSSPLYSQTKKMLLTK